MSEYKEVSFHVLFNVADGNHVSDRIMKSLRKIKGIVTVVHPNNTNAIYVSANWNESETDEKIKQIQKIAYVTGISSEKEL